MNLTKLLIIAVAAMASLALIALSDGPIETKDAKPWTGDNGVTHSSTVYYGKTTNPFVAYVDRIYFGGRPPDRGRYFRAILMTLISDGARSMIFEPENSALARSQGPEESVLDSCKFQGFVAKFSRYLPLSGDGPPQTSSRGNTHPDGSANRPCTSDGTVASGRPSKRCRVRPGWNAGAQTTCAWITSTTKRRSRMGRSSGKNSSTATSGTLAKTSKRLPLAADTTTTTWNEGRNDA